MGGTLIREFGLGRRTAGPARGAAGAAAEAKARRQHPRGLQKLRRDLATHHLVVEAVIDLLEGNDQPQHREQEEGHEPDLVVAHLAWRNETRARNEGRVRTFSS